MTTQYNAASYLPTSTPKPAASQFVNKSSHTTYDPSGKATTVKTTAPASAGSYGVPGGAKALTMSSSGGPYAAPGSVPGKPTQPIKPLPNATAGISSYNGNTPGVGPSTWNQNTNIYTPQQSQEAVNLARAQMAQGLTLPGILEKSQRSGMAGDSPYMQGQAMTNAIGPGYVAMQQAGAKIPFSDATANAQNKLQYQNMAAQQAIGYGDIANRVQSAQNQAQLNDMATLTQLLGGLY